MENAIGRASGFVEFIPRNIEKAPEEGGVYLVIAAGQKVIYVGQTGDRSLRECLWSVLEEQPFGALEYFRHIVEPDRGAAEKIAAALIADLKPPHNVGYARFRNDQVKLPKQGHSIRHAAPNP